MGDTVPLIDAGLRADTIVWVVQTDGEDDFLYFGPAPECVLTSVPVGSIEPTSWGAVKELFRHLRGEAPASAGAVLIAAEADPVEETALQTQAPKAPAP